MRIYALSDLHLSFSCGKPMDVFGDLWKDHAARIEENWQSTVTPDDAVLVAGDIGWAMSMPEAKEDLAFLERLNGTKVILRGNHDYWWNTASKLNAFFEKKLTFFSHIEKRWSNLEDSGKAKA